jgi:ABC-type antimicrobial peptide transport system permease subunit
MAAVEEIRALPVKKIVQIAWRGIRIRLLRSLLVTSGIILAIAFLSYILCSDSLSRHVHDRGSQELQEQLMKTGKLTRADDADARIQTRWMVGLALLISFVGIVNAMLMSVTERFREIGTMKCLGALDQFIVKLFMLESTFQGIGGTALGVVIGAALAYTEGMTVYGSEVWGLTPALEATKILTGCFIAGLLLTIAGALYPASQAAKMQPVDALRTEV